MLCTVLPVEFAMGLAWNYACHGAVLLLRTKKNDVYVTSRIARV